MNDTIDTLVSDIEDAYSIADSYSRCVKFMIASLELISQYIPGPVADCFEVAKIYWSGGLDRAELDRSRVRCWRFLEGLESKKSGESASAPAVRALICVLYPEPQNSDIHELLYWFLQQAGAVADVDDRLVEFMRRYFPKIG